MSVSRREVLAGLATVPVAAALPVVLEEEEAQFFIELPTGVDIRYIVFSGRIIDVKTGLDVPTTFTIADAKVKEYA